mmetsp:Transcript_31636/g.98441  ORF Transcript_31636/g.98441 Transcript_31636/m.98441 type:complete len:451 (-) Transcript_31636:223-1575(-)
MPFAAATTPEAVGISSAGLRSAFERLRAAASPSGQPLSGGMMAVSRYGRPCFVDCFGALYEFGGPMSPDAVFHVASMTKSITSIAALILMEEGKLSLEDPVSKWFPAMAKENLHVVGPGNTTVPCERDMLVWHLLTHTSGLTYGFMLLRPEGDPMAQADASDLALGMAPRRPEDYAKCILSFQPGTRFRYSHASHLLAHVVEAASGLALEEFFRKRIFAPLGMTRTSYVVSNQDMLLLAKPQLGTSKRAEKTSSQVFSDIMFERDRGVPEPGQLSMWPGKPGRSPAAGDGGLHSTPEDWHLLMEALVHRGRGLMSEETFSTMTAPATPDLADPSFNTHLSDRPDSGGQFLCGSHAPLGQGGLAHSLIGETAVGPNVLGMRPGAFGWEGMISTKYVVDPREELTVSLWANVAPCWRYALKQEVLPLVYRALSPPAVPHVHCWREPLPRARL